MPIYIIYTGAHESHENGNATHIFTTTPPCAFAIPIHSLLYVKRRAFCALSLSRIVHLHASDAAYPFYTLHTAMHAIKSFSAGARARSFSSSARRLLTRFSRHLGPKRITFLARACDLEREKNPPFPSLVCILHIYMCVYRTIYSLYGMHKGEFAISESRITYLCMHVCVCGCLAVRVCVCERVATVQCIHRYYVREERRLVYSKWWGGGRQIERQR